MLYLESGAHTDVNTRQRLERRKENTFISNTGEHGGDPLVWNVASLLGDADVDAPGGWTAASEGEVTKGSAEPLQHSGRGEGAFLCVRVCLIMHESMCDYEASF